MLNRDRQIVHYGISVLRRAVIVTLIVLAYIGFSGKLSTDSFVTPLFAAASASSLAWLLCGIPRVFQRHVHYITGGDDELPALDRLQKSVRRLRREATEDLRKTADGWHTSSPNPLIAEARRPMSWPADGSCSGAERSDGDHGGAVGSVVAVAGRGDDQELGRFSDS